jgi:hypothetical protein
MEDVPAREDALGAGGDGSPIEGALDAGAPATIARRAIEPLPGMERPRRLSAGASTSVGAQSARASGCFELRRERAPLPRIQGRSEVPDARDRVLLVHGRHPISHIESHRRDRSVVVRRE